MSDDVVAAVREYVEATHTDVLSAASDCADAVTAGWDGEFTTERDAVGDPLETTLRRAGVLQRLPEVLVGAVDAAGGQLSASPVAAAPYVVVTSTGIVLRATLDAGRLVISLGLFDVERGNQTRYVRRPEVQIDVEFR